MGQRLHVKYDAAKLSASAIAGAVADAGMRAWLEHEEPIVDERHRTRRAPRLLVASRRRARRRASRAELVRARRLARARACFAVAIAAGVPLTARKAWQALRLAVARHQRADARRGRRRGRARPVVRSRRGRLSVRASRRRSRRGRSSARGTRSAR